MSEIIGLVGISHSPFATMLPPPDASAPGGRFLADAARVAAAVARLAPDAVVVIGPDHFHANFYDVMPPFVLGVEEAEGFGDFGSRSGPLPVASGLAWPIRDGLAGAGFDVALSYALTVDHGVVQSYDVLCGAGAGASAGTGTGAGAGAARGRARGRGPALASRWCRSSSTPPRRRCRAWSAARRSAGRSGRRSAAPSSTGGCC